LLPGAAVRSAMCGVALPGWIGGTWSHARRIRLRATRFGETSLKVEERGWDAGSDGKPDDAPLDVRRGIVLALVIVAFAIFVFGVMRLGWDFDQMAALFFAMGLLSGMGGGLGGGGAGGGVRPRVCAV